MVLRTTDVAICTCESAAGMKGVVSILTLHVSFDFDTLCQFRFCF